MSQSSMMATAQASLLKCEASLSAMQAAFSEVRRELAEVRTALDNLTTSRSSHHRRLDKPRSPWVWDHAEETISSVPEQVTYGEFPGLRVI